MATYSGTPRTWSSGETVTAALMNSDVRDPLAALAGAWNSYTPTVGGFTAGNGTVSGRYIRVGKFVHFEAELVFGTTTTAATAAPTFTLPVTAFAGFTYSGTLTGWFSDTSAAYTYRTSVLITSTTRCSSFVIGTNGVGNLPTTTSPFTWTTGDVVHVGGIYEAA